MFTTFRPIRVAGVAGVVAVALSLWGAALCCAQVSEDAVGQVTIILVRHAEKVEDGTRDPVLSEIGEDRAAALAHVLGDLPVTHLFASEYMRTQLTLAPLAQKTGLSVEERSARAPEDLISELQRLPDAAVVVVAGHSNTVPDLVKRLGGEPTGLTEHPQHGWLLADDEYSRLFVVTLIRNASAGLKFSGCLELRYGSE